ncbi:solute carrier family 2, facilitated glucose transporter member 7-like [Erythrolamprus reginae]|uniref:solute carrier family 2, facilitated glucose transporter member 7-like n=1 Tax=Erythrolamprus reginae TaxID=121349 RepID=UPI00396D04D8
MLLQNQHGIDQESMYFIVLMTAAMLFVPLGGIFGVFLWGRMADRYGRKCTILISNVISVVSAAMMCSDAIFRQFEFNLFTRFFVGVGSGTFTYSVPLYILEISPLNLRGVFVTSSILFYSWGHFAVQILGHPQVWGNKESYTLLTGITAMSSVLSSILLVYSPESPRFLYLQRNDEDKARQVLMKLRGEEDVEEEMEELRQEQLAESDQENMTVWKLLHFRSLRWHLITLMVLVSGSQFVETSAVLIFTKRSLRIIGMSSKARDLLILAVSLVIQLMLLTNICLVEPLGRKFLLLSGFLMCSLTNICLVFSFQTNNPTVAFLSIILSILYFMGHITGPASILPLIVGELFLQSSRASAYVLAGLISWGTNLVLSIMLLLTSSFLGSYYLLLYWPFIAFTYIYILRVLPETSGKTFEEIQGNMLAHTSKSSRKITAE